ncbi:acyl carrier protein [Ruminiclostridium papyrosolvens]|uniref:Phosphopantetheine-binding protein n=1 Tax=Ruminiclostridium papyrosolvens C7 TaxID=1330534 RepID=U4R6L7_9FIRM|nr:phosphopantetheine-binding protein [Ruminiclostridium papyrosolvens]EPR13611.1 phosphopantetheine-binding protein [Ruminiclostridium papyrosolvens C7]
MGSNVYAEKISEYIMMNTNLNSIDYNLDIFEEGLVSSLFAIELMTFLEKNFEVKVTMDDLDMENFKCVNNIVKFVENKRNGGNV